MQHDMDQSQLGVIDIGDIVLIKRTSMSEVVTYVEGMVNGHRTYGDYGDVIIYDRPGLDQPIIHRALCRVEYNVSSHSFDVPSLANVPSRFWEVQGNGSWWNITSLLVLKEVGFSNSTVELSIPYILTRMGSSPHGGLITMGDNNIVHTVEGSLIMADQSDFSNIGEPIQEEEILGRAEGEVPWIGLARLTLSGQWSSDIPLNSRLGCIILLPLIIVVPSLSFSAAEAVSRRLKKKNRPRT